MCPKCHGNFGNKSKRTAQFGGVGGQTPQPYSPGSGPISGTNNNRNFEMNPYFKDQSLDAYLDVARDTIDSSNEYANIEHRLEKDHTYYEDAAINYKLTWKERQKLRTQKQIEERNRSLVDAIDSVAKNDPDFVRKHYLSESEEDFAPTEQKLEDRHKNHNEVTPLQEMTSPEPDPPTRIMATGNKKRIAIADVNDEYWNYSIFGINDDAEEVRSGITPHSNTFNAGDKKGDQGPLSGDHVQMTDRSEMGSDIVIENQENLDEKLDAKGGIAESNTPNRHDGPKHPNLMYFYDGTIRGNEHINEPKAKENQEDIFYSKTKKNDSKNKGTEQKLNDKRSRLKYKIESLPKSLDGGFDMLSDGVGAKDMGYSDIFESAYGGKYRNLGLGNDSSTTSGLGLFGRI